jgi:hypothetical protein
MQRFVSVHVSGQGELVGGGAAGSAGLRIVGGSGRYREARGAIYVEARAADISQVTLVLRSTEGVVTATPTATPGDALAQP